MDKANDSAGKMEKVASDKAVLVDRTRRAKLNNKSSEKQSSRFEKKRARTPDAADLAQSQPLSAIVPAMSSQPSVSGTAPTDEPCQSAPRPVSEGDIDIDVNETPENQSGQPDVNTVKKKKKRRTPEGPLLDLGEDGEKENVDGFHYLAHGLHRQVDVTFKSIRKRHLLVQSSLKESNDVIEKTGQKPSWIKDCHLWIQNLIASGGRQTGVVRNGKAKGFGVDAAFIFLPTGLCPTSPETPIPDMFLWDPSLPRAFFNCMDLFLADNGYAAVLHAGDHQHIHDIIQGYSTNGNFQLIYSFAVILEEALFKSRNDFPVKDLRLEIYCKSSAKAKLPKDKHYETWSKRVNVSTSSLFPLYFPKEDPYPQIESLGRFRLPTGFMQRVIELLTIPGDIFWDLSAGCGSSFPAGDQSGRFVVGFENRTAFLGTCSRVFQKTLSPPVSLHDNGKTVLGSSKKKAAGRSNPWAACESSSDDEREFL